MLQQGLGELISNTYLTMIARIKSRLFRLFEDLSALPLRLNSQVQLGLGCHILGLPHLRLKKGSRLQLGDQVTLCSTKRFNPLLRDSVHLETLSSGATIELAHHVGISGCRVVCCNEIRIGAYTIIGPDTLLYDSEGHDYDPTVGWSGRSKRTGRPIRIGERCFIGARCTILSGVTIGDQCVISAGSVVSCDIPAGHIASGNPASFKPLPKILGGPGKKRATQTNH